MKKISFLLLIFLVSCIYRRNIISHEMGYVVEKQFNSAIDANGTTLTTGGHVGFTQMHEDEKYIIVFKCQHGVVFPINRKELYAKLNKGDSVIIDYYELVNGKGEVKDFDFIDANLIIK